MSSSPQSMTFVVEEEMVSVDSDKRHHPSVEERIRQTFQLINPDFVLHVGEVMRVSTSNQLPPLTRDVRSSLTSPHKLIAEYGSHEPVDVERESQSLTIRAASHGIRFIRIKTTENQASAQSEHQKAWLSNELLNAQERQEHVVVLQDDHPSSASQDFSGAGIEGWRELMTAEHPVVVLCGHSHYWRLTKDGLQVSLTARSTSEKPIRAPGFLIAHSEGDDFAAIYRTADDDRPAVIITHPRDQLLSIGPQHSANADDEIRVRIWSTAPLISVVGTLNQEWQFELRHTGDNLWSASLADNPLGRGVHLLRVVAESIDGLSSFHEVHFRFDQTQINRF